MQEITDLLRKKNLIVRGLGEMPPWYNLLYNFLVTHLDFMKFGDLS